MKKIFLLLTILGLSIGVNAISFVSGYHTYTSTSSSTVELTSSTQTSGTLTLPSSVSYNGASYAVTQIGNSAFSSKSEISGTLLIPNTVIAIGDNAFSNCSGLNGSLTIPNSVNSIGESVFSNCSGFTGTLTIPNSVTSIGSWSFYDCSGFTGSLTIPNSVTCIKEHTFHNCYGFTGDLSIPASVISIGESAFSNCSGFTGTLTIPNSVTSIGEWAFSKCSGFTGTLTIPNSVTSIGGSAFSYCSGFTGNLTLPNSIASIESDTFEKCSGLTGTLIIPNSVTSIGGSAFSYCSGFTGSLIIPNSITEIGGEAFRDCTGFTGSLTIPNSVVNVGARAFQGCWGFKGTLTISNSITSIESNVFRDCKFTGTLTIPNSITSIGYYAFNSCSNDIIIIPGSVTYIGELAFSPYIGVISKLYCYNENPLDINLSIYPPFDFYSFSTLYVPKGSKLLYQQAEHWKSFRIIEEFDAITEDNPEIFTVDYHTYTKASSSTVELTSSTQTSGTLTIPSLVSYNGVSYSVTQIGFGAFWGKSELKGDLLIPNTVQIISDYAFKGCSGFKNILNIPNSVTDISQSAFQHCTGFTKIILQSPTLNIGSGAFNDCSNVVEFYSLNTTPPKTYQFYDDTPFTGINGSLNNLCVLYVPNGCKEIYKTTEHWNFFKTIVELNSNQNSININNKLTIYADKISTKDEVNGKYELSGRVTINNLLDFTGTVNLENLHSSSFQPSITGDGKIYMTNVNHNEKNNFAPKLEDVSNNNENADSTKIKSNIEFIVAQNDTDPSSDVGSEIIRSGTFKYSIQNNILKESVTNSFLSSGFRVAGLNTTFGDLTINETDISGNFNPHVAVDYTLFDPPYPFNIIFNNYIKDYKKNNPTSTVSSYIPKEISGTKTLSKLYGINWSFKIDLKTQLKVSMVLVEGLKIEYDGLTNLFNGGIDVAWSHKPIDTGLGSILRENDKFKLGLDFTLNDGLLSKFQIDATTGTNGAAIPGTMLRVSKIGLGYEYGVSLDPSAWRVDLFADIIPIEGSPLNPGLLGVISLDKPIIWAEHIGFKFGAPCYFKFGGNMMFYKWKFLDALVESGINDKNVYIGAQILANLDLADILKIKLSGAIGSDESGSHLNVDGTLKVPDKLPYFFDWLGCSGKELSNISGEIKNYGISLGTTIEGYQIGMRVGLQKELPFYNFTFGTNYNNVMSASGSKVVSGIAKVANSYTLNSKIYSFTISDLTPNMIIYVNDPELSLPTLKILNPNGKILNSTEYTKISKPEKKSEWYIVNKPLGGNWQIEASGSSATLKIEVKSSNMSPTVMFETPAQTSTGYNLKLLCNNMSDSVTVRFYYDSDNQGFDGNIIVQGKYPITSEINYNWNTSGLRQGTYHIYCVVDDNKSIPVKMYSSDPISIKGNFELAPQSLTANLTNNQIVVAWKKNEDKRIANNIVYFKNLETGSVISFISDTCLLNLGENELIKGTKYAIWTLYVDTLGNQGQSSNIVQFANKTSTNSRPIFVAEFDWLKFAVGTYKEYELKAIDVDEDPLTFSVLNNTLGLKIKNNKLCWNPSSVQSGSHTVQLKVTDGYKSDTITRHINVSSSMQFPSVKFNSIILNNMALNTVSLIQPAAINTKFENVIFVNKRTKFEIVLPAINISENEYQSVIVLTNNNNSFIPVLNGDTILVKYSYKGIIYSDYGIYSTITKSNSSLENETISMLKAKYNGSIIQEEIIDSNDPVLNDKLIVWPNPSRGIINIEFKSQSNSNNIIRIVNVMGQIIYSSNEYQIENKLSKVIDISHFKKGEYLVIIQTLEGDYCQKIFFDNN